MRHYVFAGRFGDVIHSIPAAYEHHLRTGERVRFTASGDFASVLEGCSYIEPLSAPVRWDLINDVVAWARAKYPDDEYVVMACYGKDYSPGYECWSFLRDSWRLSRSPALPETVPLVFDRRNPAREKALLRSVTKPGRKFGLISTFGHSSPFPYRSMLVDDVRAARPDVDLIDLDRIRAEKVFDLIALYEHAEFLVSIDTMHLHLSAAVPELPVYALICNGPTTWNRTDWNPRQVWRRIYHEYPDSRQSLRDSLTRPTLPRIHHVWSEYSPSNPETARRIQVAKDSWIREAMWAGNWHSCGLRNSDLPRTMKEDSDLVFVKDLIDAASSRCEADHDIISLSNSDVGCVFGVTGRIMDSVRKGGASFAHRWDSGRIEGPLSSESQVARLHWYPGSDWFWMSKAWWVRHRDEMPDMVIGREFWDAVLRQIIKKHGGEETSMAIWHEKHASAWEQPGNRENLPGNRHNGKLATEFFRMNRSDANDPYRTTWNIQPGLTAPFNPPRGGMVVPTHRTPNIVLPLRLRFRFQPNQPFRHVQR